MKRTGLLFCVFLCAASLFAQTAASFDTRAEGSGVVITGYRGQGGDVVIPASIGGKAVVGIGDSAFYYSRSLTSVTIPDSVTSIGGGVFVGCSSLASITVSAANQQYQEIEGALFTKDGKTLLAYPADSGRTAYTIPAGVASIPDSAFYGCRSLTSVTIPAGVTTIGYTAFSYCSGLTSITIPAGVTTIGGSAFYGCGKLEPEIRADIENRFGRDVFDDGYVN
jgi:hypothetical protein